MTLSVNRQVIRNRDGKIKYWKSDDKGREHYNIGVWLDGSDDELDSIEHVEYLLHPSFKNNLRSSKNRINNFSITIWTWGYFGITITVFYKDGKTTSIPYGLSYDLPSDDGSNYIRVS
jgi:transcription initiation factor IIF auxiliary subunit